MTSKEDRCGRSIGMVYSLILNDLDDGNDRRGRNELIHGLYGLIFRSINNIRGISPGKATAELDSNIRLFLRWIKNADGRDDSVRLPYLLDSLFRDIQRDLRNFENRGHAYGRGSDEIVLPIVYDDDVVCFIRNGGDVIYRNDGYPMSAADFSRLFPGRFATLAEHNLPAKSLRMGRVWVRDQYLIDVTMSLIWLSSMIDFENGERVELLDPPGERDVEPDSIMHFDDKARILVIFGTIESMEDEYYNTLGGIDANALNKTYLLRYRGGRNKDIRIRHYRRFGKPPEPDGVSGRYDPEYKEAVRSYRDSGALSRQDVRSLLRDIAETDLEGIKETIVVIGGMYSEDVDAVRAACTSNRVVFESASNLDGGDMESFLEGCSRLFDRKELLNLRSRSASRIGQDGSLSCAIRKPDHRMVPRHRSFESLYSAHLLRNPSGTSGFE